MPSLSFVPSVIWENEILVPVSYYPGLVVPPGVQAREPFAVTWGQMSKMAPGKVPAPAGLTEPKDFEVKLQGHWSQTKTTPPQWVFQSGDLKLSVTVAVYIIDKLREIQKAFELILSHELLHVLDDLEIAHTYLPDELSKDTYVKQFLIEQKPVDDTMYRNWFLGDMFAKYVRDIWILERNRRGDDRDSGPLHEKYKLAVSKLLP
jgi:hypothetical protein